MATASGNLIDPILCTSSYDKQHMPETTKRYGKLIAFCRYVCVYVYFAVAVTVLIWLLFVWPWLGL